MVIVANPTPSVAPRFDLTALPPIVRVGVAPLATLTTADEHRDWGYRHGLAGIKPEITPSIPHSFFSAIHQGYRDGIDEAMNRALLMSAPTDEELAANALQWVDPSPHTSADLVTALLAERDRYRSEGGYLGEFLDRLLTSVADDVDTFEARTYAEFDGRQDEMIASTHECRECSSKSYAEAVL